MFTDVFTNRKAILSEHKGSDGLKKQNKINIDDWAPKARSRDPFAQTQQPKRAHIVKVDTGDQDSEQEAFRQQKLAEEAQREQ